MRLVLITISKVHSKLTRVYAGDSDITNSSSFNDVSDDKFLDSFVLWNTSCTVSATDSLYVSTVVFAASSITTFLSLKSKDKQILRLEI